MAARAARIAGHVVAHRSASEEVSPRETGPLAGVKVL